MQNKEVVINGLGLKETINDFELLFDEFHNDEFCTMTKIRDYLEYYVEENIQLKDENEHLKAENQELAIFRSNTYKDEFTKFVDLRKEIDRLTDENWKLKDELKQNNAGVKVNNSSKKEVIENNLRMARWYIERSINIDDRTISQKLINISEKIGKCMEKIY